MKETLLIVGIAMLFSCTSTPTDNLQITKEEMLSIAKECDSLFRVGVQKKDTAYIVSLYTETAQYVLPQQPILVGRAEIEKEWKRFLRMKEQPIDLILNTNDVSGNREVIYETGQGYTLLADSSRWNFNYVNVWRLQKDGSYKLDIDIYN